LLLVPYSQADHGKLNKGHDRIFAKVSFFVHLLYLY